MKITKERLRQIITEELEISNTTGYEELEKIILTGDGGKPADRFTAIVNALNLFRKGQSIDDVANALNFALVKIK